MLDLLALVINTGRVGMNDKNRYKFATSISTFRLQFLGDWTVNLLPINIELW